MCVSSIRPAAGTGGLLEPEEDGLRQHDMANAREPREEQEAEGDFPRFLRVLTTAWLAYSRQWALIIMFPAVGRQVVSLIAQ